MSIILIVLYISVIYSTHVQLVFLKYYFLNKDRVNGYIYHIFFLSQGHIDKYRGYNVFVTVYLATYFKQLSERYK